LEILFLLADSWTWVYGIHPCSASSVHQLSVSQELHFSILILNLFESVQKCNAAKYKKSSYLLILQQTACIETFLPV
jgi:hypothetical protein